MAFDQMRSEIIEEIGPDVYSRYNEERYAIPELLVHVLVDACLIEFLKGFFDFESLGKGVRARVDKFVCDFREGQKPLTLDIRPTVDEALSQAHVPNAPQTLAARECLISTLVVYGMAKELASAHAAAVERSILSELSKNEHGTD